MEDRGNLLAISIMGLCAVVGLAGAVAISLSGQAIPEALTVIVSTCIGAIGGYVSQPKRVVS